MIEERIKRIIEQEKDPAILQVLIMQVAQENARLKGVIDQIQSENARREQNFLNIEEQIKIIKRSLYGRSSEKRSRTDEEEKARDKSQEEAKLFSQSAFPAPDEPKTQKEKWKSVPEKTIEHGLSREELELESMLREIPHPSADQWEEIKNSFDKVCLITVVERTYEKENHLKKKYKLKDEFNLNVHEKDVIITANGPSTLLPGMRYTTEFVSQVVSDKYISHMPLDRQAREMKSLGLPGVHTSTLSRLCALSAASFEPMAERIKLEILAEYQTCALHLDETPWKIQNKDQKNGYMGVIANRFGVYYFYKATRSGQAIKDALLNFKGAVLTDGYAGYDALKEIKIIQGFCWSHARRKFLPLEKQDAEVKKILDEIDLLFAIEREASTFDELKKLRLEKSKPIVEKLLEKLKIEHPKSRPQSQKRNAIEYLLKRWHGFTLFLDDIRFPLSNNEAERSIRPATVGRKNYYGSNNHTGAETAATHFTIIESCKRNQIDPRSFILMSLKRMAEGKSVMTPLQYAKYLRVPADPI